MAISTGDINATAITEIQAQFAEQERVLIHLTSLCFIFKKKYELDGEAIRGDFQDMVDWFNGEAWTDRVIPSWRSQTIELMPPTLT